MTHLHCVLVFRHKVSGVYRVSDCVLSGEDLVGRMKVVVETMSNSVREEEDLVSFSHEFLPTMIR